MLQSKYLHSYQKNYIYRECRQATIRCQSWPLMKDLCHTKKKNTEEPVIQSFLSINSTIQMNNATTVNNSCLCESYPFINNLSKCGFQQMFARQNCSELYYRIVDFNLDMELMHQLMFINQLLINMIAKIQSVAKEDRLQDLGPPFSCSLARWYEISLIWPWRQLLEMGAAPCKVADGSAHCWDCSSHFQHGS